jgi:regulator of RNase E activity RraA
VPPADDELWAALRRHAAAEPGCSSLVSDALGRAGGVDARIAAVWSGARCVGPALTVRSGAGDLGSVVAAIDLAEPGAVLVIERPEGANVALWGEHTTLSARHRGLAGVVLDAPCRDRAAHAAAGFAVFAAGVMPQGARRIGGGAIGVPIVVGGVAVAAGDAIVADEDGVVVVPRARLAEVVAALPATIARDRDTRAALQAGGTLGTIAPGPS